MFDGWWFVFVFVGSYNLIVLLVVMYLCAFPSYCGLL